MSRSDNESDAAESGRSRLALSPKQIAGAVVLILLIVFIVENTRRVTVRLIVPEVHTSLAVALLIAGALGALTLLLVQTRRRHR